MQFHLQNRLDVLRNLLAKGLGFLFDLLLFIELVHHNIHVLLNFFDRSVVRIYKFLQLLNLLSLEVLEALDLSPHLEVVVASQPENYVWVVGKVHNVDSTVVAHDEGAEVKRALALGRAEAQNVRLHVQRPKQLSRGLELLVEHHV